MTPVVLSDASLARMRVLWEERHELTAADIGGCFGVSKNQVIGIAHRNGWVPRRLDRVGKTIGGNVRPVMYIHDVKILPKVGHDEVILTLFDRCALLHEAMDRVLRETTDEVSRARRIVANAPKLTKRVQAKYPY